MNSRVKPAAPTTDLVGQLQQLNLPVTAAGLPDLLARATTGRWSPTQLLEEIARMEIADRTARHLRRRQQQARLGRFKPLADFDWNWPLKIDRGQIEGFLRLDFLAEKRNLVLTGANGLGKTCLTKNIAFAALQAGHTVMFRTAAELVADLNCDSPPLRKHKLTAYSRVDLLCLDEVGYLSYDASSADLLYEVVNRRYEEGSLIVTTNRAFKEWNEVFPQATCIAALLDRLLHHADVILLEGRSYRLRESEAEATARRKRK